MQATTPVAPDNQKKEEPVSPANHENRGRRSQNGSPTRKPRTGGQGRFEKLSDAEIDAAKANIPMAFTLVGLNAGETLICPACDTTKPKKVVARGHYWKCFRCGEFGSSVTLVSERCNVGFREAVNLINGKVDPASVGVTAPDPEELKRLASKVESQASKARFDAETVAVYDAVLNSKHASLAKAQESWAEFHIAPEFVAEQRSRFITDPVALGNELLGRFDADLLVESGIAARLDVKQAKTRDMHGAGIRFLFSASYPIVEPCLGKSGSAMELKFRAWGRQRERIAAHKAGKGPYVPAMLSLRGATPAHLVGYGIERLGQVGPSLVYVVEGFKDLLAARTLGAEAFGLPGTGVLPPAKVVQFLAEAGHTLLVALDGDEAGREARSKVIEHFVSLGFPAERLREKDDMPEGMDVADILAARIEAQGKAA